MAQKKQLNFGLVDAVVVQQITAATQKFTSDLMNDGYGKLNKKQFMADFSEVFGPTVARWVRTGMSAKDSKRAATRDVVRRRMVEDVNVKVKDLMVEIKGIIEAQVDKVLEDYYGPVPSDS